jgi:hypothetical protein
MKNFFLTVLFLACASVNSAPLEHEFKSPSFSGDGYSAHILTIENQEHSRKEAIKKEKQAAIEKALREAEDTNLNKFLNNLESRIYAQISQDLATAMFADDASSPTSGTLNFEGNIIYWDKSSGDIELQVTDIAGSTTTLTIPLGDFTF